MQFCYKFKIFFDLFTILIRKFETKYYKVQLMKNRLIYSLLALLCVSSLACGYADPEGLRRHFYGDFVDVNHDIIITIEVCALVLEEE